MATNFKAKHITTRGTIAVLKIATLQTELNGQPFDFELPLSRLPENAEGKCLRITIEVDERIELEEPAQLTEG